MHIFIMIFIELIFIMVFGIILLDVKQKKNITLAFNTILVFIIIMIMKLFMWLWALKENMSVCDFTTMLYCKK